MFALIQTGRKCFFALIVLLLLSFVPVSQTWANSRYASIVIDANTGEVLHESNANASRYPASLTKMMTLYMLFEAIERRKMTLNTQMPVSAHAASMPQTNIGLRVGETLSVRDAISALIVRSANDAAAVVAEALGTTESNFGSMMTQKARQLGMTATTFRNASGLPNSAQKTTARDMARLSSRLMKDFPQYYHYFSTPSFRYKGRTYNSHNRMVRNTQGVDGLKTGFIRASGFNVATSAKRNNRRVIAVVMGGNTAAARDQHVAQLLDRSFNQVASRVASRPVNRNQNAGKMIAKAPIPVAKPSIVLARANPDPAAILRGEIPPPSNHSGGYVTPASFVVPAVSAPRITQVTQSVPQAAHHDSWAVQIGSYHEPDRAHAQARAATRWVAGEVAVVEVEISNRTVYRARLIGFQKKQAHTVCQNLSRQGMDCLVVRSHG
ncbi:MAG: D-alanyl-D-alanine carboxypeptidase [Nitrosomonas sp.]|nr:D-alanyl-D-alanine carboxypeptidase [Nitrosomonas sp.]